MDERQLETLKFQRANASLAQLELQGNRRVEGASEEAFERGMFG